MPRLPLFLALLLSFAAFAGEVQIDDTRYVTAGPNYTRNPAEIVTSGDGFLVTWQQYLFGTYYPALAVRAYDADGNPLRPEQTIAGTRPRIFWTGDAYLAIDEVPRPRFGFTLPQPQVFAQRLARDGSLLGPRRGYFTGTRGSELLSAAWNGTRAAALINLEYKRLMIFDREGALLSDTPVEDYIHSVAPKGDSFLLLPRKLRAITAGNDRYAAIDDHDRVVILDANGEELERLGITRAQSLSWDGSAWYTAVNDSAGRVCTIAFTSASDVRTQCRGFTGAQPVAGAIPRRTFLAWKEPNEVIVTDSGIASLDHLYHYALASAVDASGLLLAWDDGAGMLFGGFTREGQRRPEFVIPGQRGDGLQLASNGDLTLIVWRTADGVFAMRLTAEGQPLHPILALGPGVAPRVVNSGDGWLVARNPDGHVLVTPISRDAVAGAERELAANAAISEAVAIAPTPDGALVRWIASDRAHSIVQRVDRNGNPLGITNELDPSAITFACSARMCIAVLQRNATFDVQPLDFDGRPLGEPRTLMPYDNDPIVRLQTMPDGSFRAYTRWVVAVIGADGTPRGSVRWNDDPQVALSGAEVFEGRTWFFYSRNGRVYVRDLPQPRSRAAHH